MKHAPPPPAANIFNEYQAAVLLGVQPATLRQWRQQRRGPAWVKVEHAVRYRCQDLEKYLAARTIPAGSDQTPREVAK